MSAFRLAHYLQSWSEWLDLINSHLSYLSNKFLREIKQSSICTTILKPNLTKFISLNEAMSAGDKLVAVQGKVSICMQNTNVCRIMISESQNVGLSKAIAFSRFWLYKMIWVNKSYMCEIKHRNCQDNVICIHCASWA